LQHLTLTQLHISGGALFAALAACSTLTQLELKDLKLDAAAADSLSTLAVSSSLTCLDIRTLTVLNQWIVEPPPMLPRRLAKHNIT
jgi:hypothetical protein